MAAPPDEGIRRVMHCDLDCFFAAVEELDDPRLRGKPVIVGGDPDRRGVVSTANYVARRYGVHSAMATAAARRLCPRGVFLRPRFERYRDLSHQVMGILDGYFLVREQVSIDEAYGELEPATHGCQPAEQIARALKAEVRERTGLIISVGVGRTKSLAKIASDAGKPDGCIVVRPRAEHDFLAPLPVGRLHGAGPHTRERLAQLGIITIGELAAADPHALERALGKQGRWLWQLANAQDERPVVADHGPPQSISRENTYERDIADLARATELVRALAESVARRTSDKHLTGRTVTLKVKWADFRIMTRQQPLAAPTASAAPIAEAALALLASAVAPTLTSDHAIRLLGVGLSGITAPDTKPLPQAAGHVLVQLALPFAPTLP